MEDTLKTPQNDEEHKQIEEAMDALESQRIILGNTIIDTALGSMKKQLEELLHEAKKTDTAPGEIRRLVTVMFADLSGYTALSEGRDPEFIREFLNNWFNDLAPIIEKYHGTIVKYIGDEIMAVFEAPPPHENGSEESVRAALEMMGELTAFNTKHNFNIGMHIGISSGWVIAGGIGSEEQQQFGVVGDCVNFAKQLVDQSNEGEILVGPEIFDQTSNHFDYEPHELFIAKGLKDSITVYRFVGIKTEMR